MFIPKLLYNSDAADGGGATETVDKPTDTNDNNAETSQVEIPKAFITEAEAKEMGFDSKEALANFIKQQKQNSIPDEEKQKALELDNASFIKFAIENGLAKEADFKSFQTLQERKDYDLVFDAHLAEFKEDNPEITNPEELTQAAKEDFEKTYKLNSENTKAKERATAKITKAAEELRSPVKSVIDSAKKQYEDGKELQKNYPEFQKLIEAKIKQHTPDKAIVYKVKDGEQDVEIEIELTDAERKAMAKEFSTPKNYVSYTKEERKELEAKLDKKMQSWVKVNKSDEINKKIFEKGIEIGKTKGSNKGADNPFPLIDSGTNTKGADGKTVKEQIRDSHNEAAKSYIK